MDLELAYECDGADDYLKRQLVCYVAGATAEELLTGEQIGFCPGGIYTGDWNGAADCVVALAGDNEDRQSEISRRAFDKANHILRENWAVVEMLAAALLKHRTLSREQVAELVEGVDRA